MSETEAPASREDAMERARIRSANAIADALNSPEWQGMSVAGALARGVTLALAEAANAAYHHALIEMAEANAVVQCDCGQTHRRSPDAFAASWLRSLRSGKVEPSG